MRRFPCVLFGLAVLTAACSAPPSSSERTAVSYDPIEDGTVDDTHKFAVGVVQLSKLQIGELAYCSGVLLAPNLVATARHCVSELSSSEIDCQTSTFGGTVPVADVLVTTDTTISPNGVLFDVASIVVPSGANQTKVCGNDIALLILKNKVTLSQYVIPVISPPMTDQSVYSTRVTAIGYGVSSPTDEAGVTAGTRRIKEDVNLLCIPGDTTFLDCFSDPIASQILTSGEFVSGNASTCEGDSGSGAYDQALFDRGQWSAFGVVSRGSISGDGATCLQPIYERFDAWGSLLVSTANQAASAGRYAAPAWATTTTATPVSVTAVSKDAGTNSPAKDANTSSPVTEGVPESSRPAEGCSAAAAGTGPLPTWANKFGLLALAVAACTRRRGHRATFRRQSPGRAPSM